MAGQELIAVVGGGLAGLAAAARLARIGHRVVVFEQRPVLGAGIGVATEPGDQVLSLPAAWRDLFTKSGRRLEAELALRGLALVPAPPRHYRLAGGGSLDLPSERGEQWTAIADALGTDAAAAWRDLLDQLDPTWQLLRARVLEDAPDARTQALVARALQPRRSLSALADRLPPELGEVVLSLAAWLGQDPRRMPGWHAVRFAVDRSFGRWRIVGEDGVPRAADVLTDLLVQRLEARGVDVRTECEVTAIRRGPVLRTAAGELPVAAVVSTVDPFSHADLTRERPDQRTANRLQRCAGPGPLWTGWRSLADLPVLEPSLPRVLVASAWSPAGPDSWAQLLTGALAAYRVHADLTGEDIRPTNKDIGPNGRPRPVRRAP